MQPARHPVLVFDGDCGFCALSADWVSRSWRSPASALPWQALGEVGLAEMGLSTAQAAESAWWVVPGRPPVGGDRAVAAALRACAGWRRWVGAAMSSPPLRWAGPACYGLVARHRHRLPGGTAACRADHQPTPGPQTPLRT